MSLLQNYTEHAPRAEAWPQAAEEATGSLDFVRRVFTRFLIKFTVSQCFF